MTLPHTAAPVPAYGTAALADVLPAVAAGLGLTEADGVPTTGLTLPAADRVCVFLIDGLGWELLRGHPDEAPFLTSLLPSSLAGTGRPLTAGFPATTATSLGSFGTGRPPGEHGLAGYLVRIPGQRRLMNQLRWQPHVTPRSWQPYPTVFQRAHAAGVATCQVSSPTFEFTPLTEVALSGGEFHGRLTGEERMDLAAERLAAADRALVYTYYSELDGMGHRHGADSDAWRGQLMAVDRLAQRLAEQLPPRSALYVTADHGMVDVPTDPAVGARIDLDAPEQEDLRAGMLLLGGEGRARHLYARPGAEADLLAAWRERLGDRFWIASRDEAIAAGWFGPVVEDRVRERIGDVVAVAASDAAVTATRREPGESSMIGMHGSLLDSELLVPLLEVRRG
ncbi:alkaline phosphatase family protein [Streptacidiphilus jiangxiensis]|uniref:Predicted pyrophosphatase or phosphodiesterase, AlkP superfamily n=1 Tax=Streptacidiphilus jiangxiensis TaxID=235985 RepID=A0A1H7KSF9_STRJI|nr:nucleotide pyrophosphatase/phosphodiesterase family protein [Streptacidiphilus jiangxiensis]SEK89702.1 Predicted pyrophosphatase or phosphodiesterase, AlkP superfamily [Streptacidiphilus jiangxiensis]